MLDWDREITDAERDSVIDRLAGKVIARRMEVPAILFLEMHRPFSYIASQALVVTSPMVAPLVGFENVQLAVKLMEKRENVELLIRRIEDLAAARQPVKGA